MNATAYAPCTLSNLGPGFDVLGMAVDGPCDSAEVSVTSGRGFTAELVEVTGAEGVTDLPPASNENTATIAAQETLRLARFDGSARIKLRKGLPIGSGLGSSAASAAAAAYATNLAIGSPLRKTQLIEACLEAERAASGRHGDNIAPALLGGLILVRRINPIDVVRLPVPSGLRIAVVMPRLTVMTRAAREAIPREVDLGITIRQTADLGALVAACYGGDSDLIARCMNDAIAEPARIPMIPGSADAIRVMREQGALGASISGSGPTLFAWCRSEESAVSCAQGAVEALASKGIEARSFTSPADCPGVREGDPA
ncbi:MAG: homoserine kinase [Planctomycetota bacterium]